MITAAGLPAWAFCHLMAKKAAGILDIGLGVKQLHPGRRSPRRHRLLVRQTLNDDLTERLARGLDAHIGRVLRSVENLECLASRSQVSTSSWARIFCLLSDRFFHRSVTLTVTAVPSSLASMP